MYPPPTRTEISSLSLHDALPISVPRRFADPRVGPRLDPAAPDGRDRGDGRLRAARRGSGGVQPRSAGHTSELQSRFELVCRLLLEKKQPKLPVSKYACAREKRRP